MRPEPEFTIFYTDDDPDDLEFFREIVDLIDDRIEVVTQSNGQQLMHALDNPPPRPYLVYLDINMPGLNGLEILKKVRSNNDHGKLPVIIFSTSKDDVLIERSRLLGASFYLPKTGIFDQLKKSIEHTLKMNWADFIPAKNNFVYNYS